MMFTAIRTEDNAPCGHKHRTEQAARACALTTFPGQTVAIKERSPKAQLSRSQRLSAALSAIPSLYEVLLAAETYAEELEQYEADQADTSLNEPDKADKPDPPGDETSINEAIQLARDAQSEVQALKEEIEAWRDNFESANMSHLPKFEELEECISALETIDELIDDLEDIAEPAADASLDDWKSYRDELDTLNDKLQEIADAESDVSFPGAY